MEEITGRPKRRNELTHAKHRRESFWQIIFPMSLGILVLLGLGVWAIVSAATGVSVRPAADVSVIFLIIPTCILSLIFLIVTAGIAYGVIWLNENLPPLAKQVQDFFLQVQTTVRQTSDKATQPVVKAGGVSAGWNALRRSVSKVINRINQLGEK